MKGKMPKPKFLVIEWQDARGGYTEWQHIEEHEETPLNNYVVQSSGYVIRESKDVIHIAAHVHFDPETEKLSQFCGDMQIPKKMIIRQWEVK